MRNNLLTSSFFVTRNCFFIFPCCQQAVCFSALLVSLKIKKKNITSVRVNGQIVIPVLKVISTSEKPVLISVPRLLGSDLYSLPSFVIGFLL